MKIFALMCFCLCASVVFGSTTSRCPYNEHLNSCGNRCEPQCGRGPFPCPMICDAPACECKDGFQRDPVTKTCVDPSRCPPKDCAANEQIDLCGNLCEPQCGHPTTICPAICAKPACVCKKGLVRDPVTGDCVLPGRCSPADCTQDEEIGICGNLCEPTCDNHNPMCIEICNPPACVCKKGLLRKGDKCVKPEIC